MRATLLAVAALALLAPAAGAATGDLTLHQCLYAWAGGDAPCVEQDLVTQPQNVVVAPDGHDVYVIATGTGTGAILGFRRDAATGDLTLAQCFVDHAVTTPPPGCTQVDAGSVLTGPYALALSPDGTSLYVLSGTTSQISGFDSGGVSRFSRDPATGTLTYRDCIGDPNSAGHNCGSNTLGSLWATLTGGIAVTPDGKDVIVSAGYRNAVTWIPRNTTDGSLDKSGAACLSDGSASNCTTPTAPLYDVDGLAVSPDGKHVYVSTWSTFALVHLTRDPNTGALSLADCFANNPASHTASCNAVTPAVLGYGVRPVVSPDGKTLVNVATAGLSNWTLDANGVPAFGACFANSTTAGCTVTPPGGSGGMGGTQSAAFTPDNAGVYSVASSMSNTLTTFARDTTTGALTFQTCLAQSVGPMCPSVIAQAMEFQTPYDVAVSPDGLDVYTVSQGNHGALLHFQREVPGGRPTGGGGGGGGGTTPPPGGATTTPPTGTTTGLPKFGDLVTLPKTRSCARRARLRIKLHVAAKLHAKRVEILVNGRRVAVRKGKQMRQAFTLKSLPAGAATVSVRVVLKNGKVVKGKRRYPTCKKG